MKIAQCIIGIAAATSLFAASEAQQAPQTANSICVYNDAAFVLRWRLRDVDTNEDSAETGNYPVWNSKCIGATSAGSNVSVGAPLVPVVKAYWGKEIVVADSVLYDPVNATSITYICKGTTLDFSCEQTTAPLPDPKDIAEAMGKFFLGFVEGLGQEIGFNDCINDIEKVYQDVKTIVDFIQTGINGRLIHAIAKGFELLGDLLKDIGEAIVACVKDAVAFAKQMKDLGAALSGNVWSIIKVVIDELVHIFHERKEISADCKTTVTSWRGGDFESSGKAVGDIVGIILDGL
eukprot:g1795.t1